MPTIVFSRYSFDLPIDAFASVSFSSTAQSSLASFDAGTFFSDRLVAPFVEDEIRIDIERTGSGIRDIFDRFGRWPSKTSVGFYRARAEGLVPRALHDFVIGPFVDFTVGSFWGDE